MNDYQEVGSLLHVYMERKPNETPEQAKLRLHHLLETLEQVEGVAINIHETFIQNIDRVEREMI